MDADFVDLAKRYTAETAEEAALSRVEILHRMRLAELRLAVIDRLGRSAEECQRVAPVGRPTALPETIVGEIAIRISIEDGAIVVDADWPGVKASRFAESVGQARAHALGLAERAINAVICEDMLASEEPDEHQRLSDAVRDYLEARGVLSECRAYDLPTEIERLTAELGKGESS